MWTAKECFRNLDGAKVAANPKQIKERRLAVTWGFVGQFATKSGPRGYNMLQPEMVG